MKKSKKRLDFLPNKLNKYSIRRFSVGTASILVGATLLFGINNEAHAAEQNEAPVKEEATNDNSASETPDYVGVNSDSLENSTLENGDDESSNDQDKDIAYTTPTEATAPRSIEPRSRVALNEAQHKSRVKMLMI